MKLIEKVRLINMAMILPTEKIQGRPKKNYVP